MKVIKGILYTVMTLILAGCLGVLVCALNPSLTKVLAEKVGSITESGREENQPSNQEAEKQAGDKDDQTAGGQTESEQQKEDETDGALPDGADDGGSQPGDAGDMPGGAVQTQEIHPGINTGWMDGQDKTGYEIPDSGPEQIPESVSGRSGYESVQEEAQEVDAEEAGDLAEEAGEGATGSGLTFDEEFYPYYAMLEENMQKLYCQIYANALECTDTFAPVVPVSAQRLKTVFEAVYNDHPELFWLQTGYACKYVPGGSCVEITLKYNDTANDLLTAQEEFDAAAERILAGAEGSESEKERYVHDALMLAAEYDLSAEQNQSAYSALVGGRSVCAGYARAFQYLMQELGIPCYYCTGYAGEDHAWNIVKLKGSYYNVDVTWDDTDIPTYDYFNKSDRAFGGTHVRTGLSVYLPACREEGEEQPLGAVSGDPGSQDSEAAGEVYISDVSDYINPNPTEPLRWQSKAHVGDADGSAQGQEPEMSAEEKKQADLEQAGITEDQVRGTLEEYYADCKKLLTEAGTGEKQYVSVVPEALWSSVERAYLNGDYWNGYVEGALRELGATHFLIQLQAQRLGGGYCRIYHNVYTY